jgi:hypothetical protein
MRRYLPRVVFAAVVGLFAAGLSMAASDREPQALSLQQLSAYRGGTTLPCNVTSNNATCTANLLYCYSYQFNYDCTTPSATVYFYCDPEFFNFYVSESYCRPNECSSHHWSSPCTEFLRECGARWWSLCPKTSNPTKNYTGDNCESVCDC